MRFLYKGDSKMKKKIIGFILLAAGLAVCVFAGYKLFIINREYKLSEDLYSVQEKKYVKTYPLNEEKTGEITVDFTGLKKENSDICAWLHIPSISVSYPVLQGENNNTYLRRLPDGTYNVGGSIFIDERCKSDFSSPVTVIYGHYMNNGTMFGRLNKFLDNSFLKTNRNFEIYTPEKHINAKIICCFETKSSSEIYNLPDENSINDYLNILSDESKADLKSIDTANENLVILSTCSHSFESARTVLIAVIKN